VNAELNLVMPGDVKIIVPDDLHVTTAYVLQEQGDWFEDEIRFVRAFIRPGMRAVDVGANFGVYSLTLARAVGAAGRVWAIEPGTQAAQFLARSIAANSFSQVEVIRCALSRTDGHGYLNTDVTPELQSLAVVGTGAPTEIRALDSVAEERSIERVDFIKVDVEGEERSVLEGAERLLVREAPLLMIEFWGANKFNVGIFEPLYRTGHDCFRLMPGINVLVPFYESEEPDAYQLNLFACKPQRAEMLSRMGCLMTTPAKVKPFFAREPDTDALFRQPYAAAHASKWRAQIARSPRDGPIAAHTAALRWYVAAKDAANSAQARHWALGRAYSQLTDLLAADFNAPRACSFIRIAAACGRRSEAVAVSRRLAQELSVEEARGVDPFTEPFVPPWPYYETLKADAGPAVWMQAAALESFEHLFQFSSCDKKALAHELLGIEIDRGTLSAHYARRERLFNRRNGKHTTAAMR
jgi:protein O-GlcNAc transferase